MKRAEANVKHSKTVLVSWLLAAVGGCAPPPTGRAPDPQTSAGVGTASLAITITIGSPSMTVGSSQALSASMTENNDLVFDVTDAVSWRSSDPSIVTVDSWGVARAVGAGAALIHAALGARESFVLVAVNPPVTLKSIQVAGVSSLTAGSSGHLVAIAVYSDGTSQDVTGQAVWSSFDGTVVAIYGSTPGDLLALRAGAASVVADFGGTRGAVTIRVQ